MANELEWLRSKATHTQKDTLIITPDEAAKAECEPGTYEVNIYSFKGTIPFRMAHAISGSKLINTETVHEVLHLGTGYRGSEGVCRYYRTVYTKVAA